MAAHPDQVFISGKPQRQVASRAAVVPGTFYLDESTSRLYIGSDPTNRGVRVTDLAQALRVRGEGTVIRGIGVRHYAPSIWNIGAVTVDAAKVRLENVAIHDTSTIGLGVVRADVVLDRVSVLRAGLLGVHAATADRLMVSSSRLDGNNSEQFNSAPVSGGIKVGRSRTVTVTDSSVSGNLGQGYWSDVSVYDTRILNSNIVGNRAAGVFLEISARGTVANNIISDNGGDGVKINNTSTVTICNNTVVRNGRALNIVQDPRRPANTSYGDDTRYPNDPEMTWLLGPVSVRNNVIGLPTSSAVCVLCVEDYSHLRTAAQMGVTSNGNVFNRASSGSTQWLTVWSRGKINVNPAVYTTLPAHKTGTAQDGTSLAYDGSTVVSTDGTLSSTVKAKAPTAADGAAEQHRHPRRPAHRGPSARSVRARLTPAAGSWVTTLRQSSRSPARPPRTVRWRCAAAARCSSWSSTVPSPWTPSTPAREVALAERALARHPAPQRVLVGGLGLGMTARAVLADPRVAPRRRRRARRTPGRSGPARGGARAGRHRGRAVLPARRRRARGHGGQRRRGCPHTADRSRGTSCCSTSTTGPTSSCTPPTQRCTPRPGSPARARRCGPVACSWCGPRTSRRPCCRRCERSRHDGDEVAEEVVGVEREGRSLQYALYSLARPPGALRG